MKKVEAIIRCGKTDDVRCALAAWGFDAITLTDVRGIGREQPHSEMYRGIQLHDPLVPRVKLEIVVDDDDLEDVVEAVLVAAFTGKVGDGRIFISDIQSVIHIRTGERHSDDVLESLR
jgi:nitrogen regulatory protein P-II 1